MEASGRSVLRQLGVDALGPSVDAAYQVVHVGEALLLEEVDGLGAAAAHLAVDNDLARSIEFADALRQVFQRDEMSAEVADLVFVRIADVEDEEVVTAVEALFQFFRSHVAEFTSCGLLFSTDAAELLVVDEL